MTIAALQELALDPAWQKLATRGTLVGEVVIEPPAELAQQAGATLEEYSLARMFSAEGYGGDRIGKAAAAVVMGQTTINEAKRRGSSSLTSLLTWDTAVGERGLYGRQHGRYASTAVDPRLWHLRAAQMVLNHEVPDLAKGAVHYLSPSAYVGGVQAGRPLGKLADVLQRWIVGEKNRTIEVPTVDPYHLLVMGPGGTVASRQADLDRALAQFEARKAGPAPGDPDAGSSLPVLLTLAALAIGAFWIL